MPGTTGGTILLVEDNPDDVLLAELEFEDFGVQNDVFVVDDGADALAFLRREPPHTAAPDIDLVLLDLHLPRLDGPDVVRAMAADPALSHIPIILLSAPTELEWAVDELGTAVSAALPKPIQVEPLASALAGLAGLGDGFLRRG